MYAKTEMFHQYLEDPNAEKYLSVSLEEYLRTSFSRAKRSRLLHEITEGSLSSDHQLYEICKRFPDRVFAVLDESGRKVVAELAMREHRKMILLIRVFLIGCFVCIVNYLL